MLQCFEGTYSRTDGEKGTFNIVVSVGLKGWQGIARENGSSTATPISGTFANYIIYMGNQEVAKVSGDTFEGSYVDNGVKVTVKANRTL